MLVYQTPWGDLDLDGIELLYRTFTNNNELTEADALADYVNENLGLTF